LPFIAPFIVLLEAELGSLALTGHGAGLTAASAMSLWKVGEIAKQVVVGTLILSPSAALCGSVVAWAIATAARKGKAAAPGLFDAAVGRVAQRYARGRRAAYHYVRGKLASDPVAARVVGLGALGEVVDVGCGRGQMAVLLLEAKQAARVVGFDWDAKKVADARDAASGLAASFEPGDMREAAIPACDTALFIDVLHYMTDAEQDAVLSRAADAARLRVIVRELDPDRGWRSGVTRLQERVTTSLGYNRGARVNVRTIDALTAPLRARGFRVSVEPCWGKTPFSNVLVVAERNP
jgi:SAM-dependent methyltransferase